MVNVSGAVWRTAKKRHVCDDCEKVIHEGARYVKQRFLHEDCGWSSWRTCGACQAWIEQADEVEHPWLDGRERGWVEEQRADELRIAQELRMAEQMRPSSLPFVPKDHYDSSHVR
jgi:hypothetical protein